MKTRRQKDLEKEDVKHLMVFKLPFHPRGVQRQAITRAYKQSGLAELQENCRFIVAQCRPRNIRNRICATTLEDVLGENPSDLLVTNPNNYITFTLTAAPEQTCRKNFQSAKRCQFNFFLFFIFIILEIWIPQSCHTDPFEQSPYCRGPPNDFSHAHAKIFFLFYFNNNFHGQHRLNWWREK